MLETLKTEGIAPQQSERTKDPVQRTVLPIRAASENEIPAISPNRVTSRRSIRGKHRRKDPAATRDA